MKFAIFFFALLLATPAFSVGDEIVEAMRGEWLIAPENGDQGCLVLLGAEQAIGGYAASEKVPCLDKSPLHEKIHSWNFDGNGGVIFLNAERKVLLRLEEQEGGPYRTANGVQPVMLMAKMPQGVDRTPKAEELFGVWTIVKKNGEKICGLNLQDQPPPGGQESFAVTLAKDCDASIKKLKLASWRIEGFNLLLYGSDGESISFTPDGKGNFNSEDGRLGLQR